MEVGITLLLLAVVVGVCCYNLNDLENENNPSAPTEELSGTNGESLPPLYHEWYVATTTKEEFVHD